MTQTKTDAEVIAQGDQNLRDRIPNRPMSKDQYDAWLAWLAEGRADDQAMTTWQARGFVSGSPHDRLEVHQPEPVEGVDWEAACEHGFSGKHSQLVDGKRVTCDTTPVFPGDYWLQPSYAPTPKHDRIVRDERRGMFPRLNADAWGAAEDAIEALMEETPHQTHDGGGLTGVEDDYWLARKLMSEPANEGPTTEEAE